MIWTGTIAGKRPTSIRRSRLSAPKAFPFNGRHHNPVVFWTAVILFVYRRLLNPFHGRPRNRAFQVTQAAHLLNNCLSGAYSKVDEQTGSQAHLPAARYSNSTDVSNSATWPAGYGVNRTG